MKAIILLSGGLDSAVILAMAKEQQHDCLAVSFDYGQRHRIELESARFLAKYYQTPQIIIPIDNRLFASSALVDNSLEVLQGRHAEQIAAEGIPNTYVPARNTLFLSYAMGLAEVHQADEIHYGANIMDSAPYPDCRPAYLEAFQKLLDVATKQAVEGSAPKLVAPLLYWDKKHIVTEAHRLGVPIDKTFSCYTPTVEEKACGVCDACSLRLSTLKSFR